MNRTWRKQAADCRRFLALVGFAAASGCAESKGDDQQEVREAGSRKGHYFAKLSGDPLRRGETEVTICFSASGSTTKVEELSVQTVPFMPAMGHGSSGVSSGEHIGEGCYQFSGVQFTMPGTWELRTAVLSPLEDDVVLSTYVE